MLADRLSIGAEVSVRSSSIPAFRLVLPSPTTARLLRALAGGTALYLLLRPLLGLSRELLVMALAGLVRLLSRAPLWSDLVALLPLDPVYTLALVQFAGEVSVPGVAVSGSVGSLLHSLWPALFLSPELASETWVSAVLETGATVLARGLVDFGANVALLAVGLTTLIVGLRNRPWLAVCGALQQAHVVLYHFLDEDVSLRDVEAAGLPFAVSSFLSDANARAPWFTNHLAQLPDVLVRLGSGVLLVGLAYALAALLVALPLGLARRCRPRSPAVARTLPVRQRLATAGLLGLLVLGLANTPVGSFAEVESTLASPPALAPASTTTRGTPSLPAVSGAPEAPDAGPRHVELAGGDYDYRLLVDGRSVVVQGMGYNPLYGDLGPNERARRYDRDFAGMRQAGVNVVFGWFQDVFTDQALAHAHRHGLGVGMPYELNQDLDYDDPGLRAQVTADVLAYVAEHKDHPAVWFWTPGNEVIHRLIFPSWLKRESDPQREARATSFARFYVQLIDQIHELDPDHPIVYRDAEEVYLQRIRDELRRDGKPRPWFAYGTNVYSSRLAEILAGWPQQGLDVPLLVAEFSPGGTGPDDRPEALRSMWTTIRSYPKWVLGGAVYTWTTEGPEELDKVFGLVDEQGLPRDGSLAMIAELFGGVAR